MEGHKNPSPLSWAWFGAVRIERKPLRYEQDFRRLLHHTHPRRRPLSYFLNPAPDKEDEQDEEEDRHEMEAATGERSSQPSTPQTPADSKGTKHQPYIWRLVVTNSYALLTKSEVGMANYWPSCFPAFLCRTEIPWVHGFAFSFFPYSWWFVAKPPQRGTGKGKTSRELYQSSLVFRDQNLKL